MKKKRKRTIRATRPPEVEKQHEETQALLAARIAYHRAKIEEERLEREQQEREAS